jgi:hypothetical protein
MRTSLPYLDVEGGIRGLGGAIERQWPSLERRPRLQVLRERPDSEYGRAMPPGILRMQVLGVEIGDDGLPVLTVRVLGVGAGDVAVSRAPIPAAGARTLVSATFGLEHDPAGARFYLRGKPLPLRPQEYRLLRFLVEHPRQLLTREQLLQGAWEDATDSEYGSLYTCLSRLRSCLGEAARMITTEPRVGYRFDPEPAADR